MSILKSDVRRNQEFMTFNNCTHIPFESKGVGQIKKEDKILSIKEINELHPYDSFDLRLGYEIKCLNCNSSLGIKWGDWQGNLDE